MGSRKGIATIMLVFIVAMILVLMITVWQSRLLTVIHRSQSLFDVMTSTYNAESKVNDLLARFLGGYPVPASGVETLSDGTVMTTEVTVDKNTETMSVSAKRQFATNQMQLTRSKTNGKGSNLDKVEIVLAVDCTGSMDSQANPSCTGSNCPTRIAMVKQSVLAFLDKILSLPSLESAKFWVGIEAFKINTQWLAAPTNDISALRQTADSQLGNTLAASPGCVIPNSSIVGTGETSLGRPTIFADDYFKTSAEPKKKQIYVLLTDGEPNVSVADVRCETVDCRSVSACIQESVDYLSCGVADTNTEWKTGIKGLRPTDVDVYAATVISDPANASEQVAYDATVAVLSNTNYVKKYYNSANAEQLPGFLTDIFGQISSDIYNFQIQRVIPTLPK